MAGRKVVAMDWLIMGDAHPHRRRGACSYQCTFCPACAVELAHACPNCGGELVRRPRRSA